MARIGDLQRQLDDLLAHPPARPVAAADLAAAPPPQPPPFSAFHLPDVYRANVLAAQWMAAGEAARGATADLTEAVRAILDGAAQAQRQASPDQDPELVRHALKLALTHYRHGLPLRIKPLEQRAPHQVLPSTAPTADAAADTAAEDNPELRLAWFREDPKLNEHHEHWHVVYPLTGVPAPGNPTGGQVKERQGELFLYMHRQMLARYDSERLAVGLERVVPWDYGDPDPWGYDPGPYLRHKFGPRPPGKAWEQIPEGSGHHTITVTPEDMATRGQHLFEAAANGYFQLVDATGAPLRDAAGEPRRVPVDAHLLGTTQEADIGTVETGVIPFDPAKFEQWYNALIRGYYGNWHNVGHDMFAYLSTNHKGVMILVSTAMRDHVFYRWHKLIDNLYDTWQETQPGNDFSDAPPVVIRKHLPGRPDRPNQSPDIILCLKRDLVPWDNWQKFGEYAFGGANWDREFASGTFPAPDLPTGFTTTGELPTQMRRRVVTIETGEEDPKRPETPHEIAYLDQEEFFYFLRVQNLSDSPRDVTVRIFLVAADPALAPDLPEDRRMWIELDKFKYSLQAGERAVIYRPAALSSVIRKPAVKPPGAEQPPVDAASDHMQEDAELGANYCDCGWPYNLLLPRGTREGLRCRLLVMLTDWDIDHVPSDCACGSMSYCGARDRYPDSRAMGYPFDRPFRDRSIAETIAAQANMATRDVVIRWV